ncbi:MAG: DUF924 domain-containing protein [Candidatus Woesearchaeota archaeon]|jgi:uncharacterized protein (DUF924 family)|nr:DUF924 domain-containing protein [Candidatus Woesearchaeota archaeon]
MESKDVIEFWFNLEPKAWFEKNPELDKKIREKFEDLYYKAINLGLTSWEEDPESTLALIILLDQFPRNMYRGTTKSFASDNLALNVAKRAIEKGFNKKVKRGRNFFYMPFMHSESLNEQEKCVEFFEEMAKEKGLDLKESTKYANLHKEIIKEFGRFPYRNEILGRESTIEEIKYLAENSGF